MNKPGNFSITRGRHRVRRTSGGSSENKTPLNRAIEAPYFERPLFFFDQQRFRRALSQDNSITIFKDAISAANTQFDTRFKEGEDIRTLVYERAQFIDCILHYAWHQFKWDRHIALLAVGGYGRGELLPYSDIDILILLENDGDNHYLGSIEQLVTFLWDIGLEIGQSVRSINLCKEIAREDITVATNILEARTIVGNNNLLDQLRICTDADTIWPADTFFCAKWDEQILRHKKYNNIEYNLEPNIKNAPGGLRDIQMIGWVAKRYFCVRRLKELAGGDFFTDEEYAILLAGEEFLWKVRYGLHMIAGRAEERLLFDHQRELAILFGYRDKGGRLAVEQFMHTYYRIVLALRELNDVLLQFLDEAILQDRDNSKITPINEHFQLCDHYIEATRAEIFQKSPSAMMEIFVLMGKNPAIQGVRATTIRAIRENRNLIDEAFRLNPVNNRLFMELLRSPQLDSQLKRMKRYGVLGRYLPEFGRVTGQMQHDLFHIYTVDAHTLLVVENMRYFCDPEAEKNFPLAANIMKRLPKPELLYIAGLYHDIGKGRGGDHSMLGALDAQAFCIQHGLNGRETRLVRWLVEKHLLMSAFSQKQDISDPDVIRNFAFEVGDQLHLDYLYTLTVADMKATNPDIWNSWRASLMRQLYLETKRALRRGLENPIDQGELVDETQQAAIDKLAALGVDEARVRELWGDLGDDYFLREGYEDIAWQTEAIDKHKANNDINENPLILIKASTNRQLESATQIFIYTRDRDNVFVAVATTLSQLGLSIQDARLYSSLQGYTIDTFYVLDENNQPIGDNPRRVEMIKQALLHELRLVDEYSDIIRRRTPRQLKHFAMPTRTSISNELNCAYTILEVTSPDRPGLLAYIGRIFLEFGIQLQNAKITTLGERVEDIFFITDRFGQPLSDPKQCEDLQREIRRQLDQQVEED